MNSVYILNHIKDEEDLNSLKLIGVYSSNLEAEKAIPRLSDKNGFKDYPEGFEIQEINVNKDHWIEGFATVTSIQLPTKKGHMDVCFS